MKKWIVTACAYPLNYNRPQSFVVEAQDDREAAELVRQELRDLANDLAHYHWDNPGKFSGGNYEYRVRASDLPEVKGRIIGRVIIAAAPEMLEALEALVETAVQWTDETHHNVKRAREAIAKARGV